MKKRRKYSDLTEHFTPKDCIIVEEQKAKMRASLQRPNKPVELPKVAPQMQGRRSNPGSRR